MATVITRGGLQSRGTAKQIGSKAISQGVFKRSQNQSQLRTGGGSSRSETIDEERKRKEEEQKRLQEQQIKEEIIKKEREAAQREIARTQDIKIRAQVLNRLRERVQRIRESNDLSSELRRNTAVNQEQKNALQERLDQLAKGDQGVRRQNVGSTIRGSLSRSGVILRGNSNIIERNRENIQESNRLSQEATFQGSISESSPQQFTFDEPFNIGGVPVQPQRIETISEQIRNRFNNLPESERNKANSKARQFGINLKRETVSAGAGFVVGLAIGFEGVLQTPEAVAQIFKNPTQAVASFVEYPAQLVLKLSSGNSFIVGEALGEISTIYLTDKGASKILQRIKGKNISTSKKIVEENTRPVVKTRGIKKVEISQIKKTFGDRIGREVQRSQSSRIIEVEIPKLSGDKRPKITLLEYSINGESRFVGYEKLGNRITRNFYGQGRIVGTRRFTSIIEGRIKANNPRDYSEVGVRRYVTEIEERIKINNNREVVITQTGELSSGVFTDGADINTIARQTSQSLDAISSLDAELLSARAINRRRAATQINTNPRTSRRNIRRGLISDEGLDITSLNIDFDAQGNIIQKSGSRAEVSRLPEDDIVLPDDIRQARVESVFLEDSISRVIPDEEVIPRDRTNQRRRQKKVRRNDERVVNRVRRLREEDISNIAEIAEIEQSLQGDIQIQRNAQRRGSQVPDITSDASLFADIGDISNSLNIQNTRNIRIPRSRTNLRTGQRTRQINNQDSLQSSINDIESDVASAFSSASVQANTSSQRIARRSRRTPRNNNNIPIIDISPELPDDLLITPRKKKVAKKTSKKKEKKVASYDIYFKKPKSKKLSKINNFPKSKKRAEDIRDFLIDNSVSRTGRIVERKSKNTKKEISRKEFNIPKGYSKKVSKKIRGSIIRKGKQKRITGLGIEKNSYLIDTVGEKRGLTAFKVANNKKAKKSRANSQSKRKKRKK